MRTASIGLLIVLLQIIAVFLTITKGWYFLTAIVIACAILDWIRVNNRSTTNLKTSVKKTPSVSVDTTRHVAGLSRLELSEDEVQSYSSELSKITAYVEQLSEVNTDGVEPTVNPTRNCKKVTEDERYERNILRNDEVRPSLSNQDVLLNAPESEDGSFKVPKIK